MENKMEIVFHPKAQPSESAGSVLLRLTQCHSEVPVTVLRQLGVQAVTLAPLLRELTVGAGKALHPYTNREEWQLPPLLRDLADGRQWAKSLDFKHARACPECAKNGTLDYWHDVIGIEACPTHGCAPLTRCPHCMNSLSWSRLGVDMCRCGERLSDTASEQAPKALINSAHRLIHWIETGDKNRFTAYQELRRLFSERYALWPQACQSVLDFLEGDTQALASLLAPYRPHNTIFAARAVIAPLVTALPSHYTPALNNLAAQIRTMIPQSSSLLPHEFALSRQELAFVLSCQLRTVDELFQGSLAQFISEGSRTRRTLTHEGLQRLLSCLTVASEYDHGSTIRALVTSHRLSAATWLDRVLLGERSICRIGDCLLDIVIDEEVEHDKQVPDGYLTCERAADYLGLYPELVRNLMKSGLLEWRTQRNHNNRYLLLKSSLDTFLSTYVTASQLAERVGAEPRRYAERLLELGISAVAGPKIDGCITYIFRKSDVDDPQVAQRALSLQKYSKAGRPHKGAKGIDLHSWSTAAEAARQLNVSVQQLAGLVDHTPLIQEHPGHGAKSTRRYFRRDSVDAAKSYIAKLTKVDSIVKASHLSRQALMRRINYLLPKAIIEINKHQYVTREAADMIIAHCSQYWSAEVAAQHLGCSRHDVQNWYRLGHLECLTPDHPDFIQSPRLFPRESIEGFRTPPDSRIMKLTPLFRSQSL